MSFKHKNLIREFPFFTHFACLPFIQKEQRDCIDKLQKSIEDECSKIFKGEQALKRHNHLLAHVTLFMMTIKRQDVRNALKQIIQKEKQVIASRLRGINVILGEVKYFTRVNKSQKCNELTVIYTEIDEKSQHIFNQLTDYLVRILLSSQIIVQDELSAMRVNYDHKKGRFLPQTFHISLFRCRNLMEKEQFLAAYEKIKRLPKEMKIKFNLTAFDVATMQQYGEDQFYLPLERIAL